MIVSKSATLRCRWKEPVGRKSPAFMKPAHAFGDVPDPWHLNCRGKVGVGAKGMKGPGRHEGGSVIQNAVVRKRDRFRPESGGIVFNAEGPLSAEKQKLFRCRYRVCF